VNNCTLFYHRKDDICEMILKGAFYYHYDENFLYTVIYT